MEESTGRQSRKRKWVALAENVQDDANPVNAVVIGNCVSDLTIGRSGLLKGIEQTDGLAALPSHLSSADFRLWETAQFIEEDLPLDDLVTVVKVADALGDANVTKWLDRISTLASYTIGESSFFSSDANVCSLFRLPTHLRHPLIAEALSLNNNTCPMHDTVFLRGALKGVPERLHREVLSAAASSGELAFGHNVADNVLLGLPGISVPSPGLLTVTITPPLSENTDPCTFCSNASTGGSLAHALSAHPSLTRLSLQSAPVPPQWLRCFSDCLAPAALPRLASLTLTAAAHPGGCAEAAACLRLLPALTSLDITYSILPQPAPAQLLSGYARLAGNRAQLPHLQHLRYVDGVATCPGVCNIRWRFGPTAQASCAPSFLSLLHAPALKSLELDLSSSLQQQALEALQRQVARLTSPHEASATAGTAAADPPPQPSCLEEFTFTSSCILSLVSVAAACAELAAPALRVMELHHMPYRAAAESDDEHGATNRHVADAESMGRAYSRAFAALRRCTDLQVLTLEGLHVAPLPGEADFTAALAEALLAATQLTHLRLDTVNESDVELGGEALGAAIAQLTGLQHLSLDSTYRKFSVTPVQAVLGACAKLQQATILDLQIEGLTLDSVAALLSKLPSLQQIHLQSKVFVGVPPESVEELEFRFGDVIIETR